MVAPARRTLRDFEETLAAVHNVKELRSGRLVVVAQPHLAADALPQLLGPFHDTLPRRRDHDHHSQRRGHRGGAALGWRGRRPGLHTATRRTSSTSLGFPTRRRCSSFLPEPTRHRPRGPSVRPRRRRPDRAPTRPSTGRAAMDQRHRHQLAHPRRDGPPASPPSRSSSAGIGAALLARPIARQAVALGAVACRLDPPIYRPAFLIDVPPPTSAAARAFLEIVEEVQASEPDAPRHPTEGRPVERAVRIGATDFDR